MSEQLPISCTPKKGLSKKARQRLFLEAFAEHANVLLSARAAGVSRRIIYTWLELDEDFSFAYNQAKEDAKDVLRAEIYRRGHDGWEEPVYQMGLYAGKVRKYSDTLLIFHSKALMSEYRDSSKVTLDANVNATVQSAGELTLNIKNATSEELSALRQLALSMKARER